MARSKPAFATLGVNQKMHQDQEEAFEEEGTKNTRNEFHNYSGFRLQYFGDLFCVGLGFFCFLLVALILLPTVLRIMINFM